MRNIISLLVAISITFFLPVSNVSAVNDSVEVKIPQFEVSVNDKNVDSTLMQYPLITYKDITYFPLTWQWCRELGLVSGYTEKDGLYIANYSSESQEVLDAGNHQAAGSKHSAIIASYPIYINGQEIDNNKEEYPLLNFRNITYFPLTWDFVVDEFAWDEFWSNTSGFKLSSQGSLKEYLPGTQFDIVDFYTLESYKDYSLIEKVIEKRSISSQPNEYGDYSNNYESKSYEYYKLDYATNKLTKITSKESKDLPYNSGAVNGEEVNDLFNSNGSNLTFKNKILLNLSEDAGVGNFIDQVYATKHTINHMDIYLTSVLFTQGDTSVPPPYTPRKYYAFIDNGDNVLHPIENWPTDQILSAVYPYGIEGVYLSSNGRIFGSSRYSNRRGIVSIVKSDLSVTTLNDQWEDWNSLNAIGSDDMGNLYLFNTWFSNYDSIDAWQGTISPIKDGYYRLDLKGNLTKVYPFIYGDQAFVTNTGQIYVDTNWKNSIIHLQSNTKIELD